jgi:mercuric ion transport protein
MVEKAMASTSRTQPGADIAEGPGSNAAGAARALLAAGGILAALGATSCCVIPFTLFVLGVSGAWIGNLSALAPYQPVFVAIALGCLGGGFVLVRRKTGNSVSCAPGSYCATSSSVRVARLGLWTAAAIVGLVLAFPYVAPLIIK